MKRWILTALVVLGLTGIAGPGPGHAATLSPPTDASASVEPSSGPPPATSAGGSGAVIDTGIGGYAAVGCGLFGRALGSGIVNVGTIAGAVATCGYMLFDALFDH